MAQNLEKITIRLNKGDKDRLNELFPALGHTKVIRTLVRNHIKKIEEKATQRQRPITPANPDINL